MKTIRLSRLALVCLTCALCQRSFSEPLPLSLFARLPELESPRISPDGKYLLSLANLGNHTAALVTDVESLSQVKPVLSVSNDQDIGIAWCGWGNPTRVVCKVSSIVQESRYAYTRWKLVAVDIDGKNAKDLMHSGNSGFVQFDSLLDWTPNDPRTVLIQAPESIEKTNLNADFTLGENGLPAVFELDIYKGSLRKVVRSHPAIRDFRSDGNGAVRLAVGFVDRTKVVYFGKPLGEDGWKPLTRTDAFLLTRELIPIRVVPNTNRALAMGPHNGRRALWEVDLADVKEPQLLAEHPQVDITNSFTQDSSGKLLGYSFETYRRFLQFEEGPLRSIMQGVNAVLPNKVNWPVSYVDDISKVVVESISDVDPGTFFLYDAGTRKLRMIGRVRPQLDSKMMGRMRSIEYPAKDGILIPGYLTVAPDVREQNLPLVVFPQGNSAGRTSWDFDYLQQFLVSRGYAVLQANFRGSYGYGNDWHNAGLNDWTGVIYSDVADGVRWAIAKGIADPKRICIIGRDFAGTVALLGAIRDGDLFKCAASIAGISDHVDYMKTRYNYRAVEKQTGRDLDQSKPETPIRRAAETKSPVLLIHGRLDTQVPLEQSEKMASELRSAGKDHEFLKLDHGTHSFWRESDRAEVLTTIEKFLLKHLGAASTEPSPP